MTAREPSAVEVIAEAMSRNCYGTPLSSHPEQDQAALLEEAEAVLAAIRAMTPSEQAEVIGGEVRRLTTVKPHSDKHPFCIPRTCPHREYDQHQERVVGPWREVQP